LRNFAPLGLYRKNLKKMIKKTVSGIDWDKVIIEMHEKGYALVPKLLSPEDCKKLIDNYDNPAFYRKTITMERYRFGSGEYKYFNYPLPDLIQTIREQVYSKLAPVANTWMDVLHIEKQFPGKFEELQSFVMTIIKQSQQCLF